MAHAGWSVRVIARKGDEVVVGFTTPQGGEETRTVPIERLGTRLRSQLDRVAPQRRHVALKVRIH